MAHQEHTKYKLIDKINPRRLGYSPMITALVRAIVNYDYGARDAHGGKITGLNISSDGFVIVSTTSHESGAFIGTASDLECNLLQLLADADLSVEEHKEFMELYNLHVISWQS